MTEARDPKRTLGLILTILGIALMGYAIIVGLSKGSIGVKNSQTIAQETIALIIGWFAVLAGPALWLGETPAAIRKAVRRS